MNSLSDQAAGGGVPIFQIKIVLKWSDPAIWRRVLVRADMRLDRLHQVIQIAMGWSNSHMHQFIAGEIFYGDPDPDFLGPGQEKRDENRHAVADLAPAAKKKFIYEYDFGDGWEHEIVVEKILPPDLAFVHPACLAGANACPPDDCGGIGGYYDLLETLADPKHPEHKHLKKWIGGKWDAAHFDLGKVNAGLKRLKA